MSRTIKVIERHMVPPSARSDGINASGQATTTAPLRRKSERKLHVVFAPWQPGTLTTATK